MRYMLYYITGDLKHHIAISRHHCIWSKASISANWHADCGCCSDGDDEAAINLPEHITVPSREVRPIIDKMAVYVVRNGRDFELMMRKKNDERFRFLNTWHPHYSYYEHQRDRLQRRLNGEPEPHYSPEPQPASTQVTNTSLDPATAKSKCRPALLGLSTSCYTHILQNVMFSVTWLSRCRVP